MLETDKIQLLLLEAEVINSIVANEIDTGKVFNYLELMGAITYQEKLDALFELFYNKLNAADLNCDFDAIFNNIALIEKVETLEVDKDIIMQDRQIIAKAYSDFLIFINTDLGNQELEIGIKLENLLKINKNCFPRTAETRRLYLFFVLNIAMAQPLVHMDIINATAEELKQLIEE